MRPLDFSEFADILKCDLPSRFGCWVRGRPLGGFCFFGSLMRTNFYIDGFNLYYGAVKGTPYKWLDLSRMCQLAFQKSSVHRIRYFTARVGRLKGNQDVSKAQRQETYLRALETIPNLEIHYGHFLQNTTRMALAQPPENGSRTVEVIKIEEKGSDVNLASYLLLDAMQGDFDAAVVVSNDSDLTEPIKLVRMHFDKAVIVLHPHREVSQSLKSVAVYCKTIRTGLLEASQFPNPVQDGQRLIHKPEEW